MSRGIRIRHGSDAKKVNIIYLVDTSVSYTEQVKVGDDILSPTSFTPTKTSYTFIGWRQDSTATSSVISSMVASEDTTLYAVFKSNSQITVDYYQPSNTKNSQSGYGYYNNANNLYPSFTLTQSAYSGWNARGWTTSNSGGSSSISVANGGTVTLSSNATYYGCYQKTVTVSYSGNSPSSGSTASTTGTAYYHSVSGTTNANVTIANNGFAKTSYTFYQWRLNSTTGTAYRQGTTYSSINDATMYAEWIQTTRNFSYTGSIQTFDSKLGVVYVITLIGGAGGGGSYKNGNKTTNISASSPGRVVGKRSGDGTTWYVCVGGKGTKATANSSVTIAGGYNGGGSATTGGAKAAENYLYGSGGGCTHIGKTNTLMKDTSSANLIAVAAGGGGAGGGYYAATGGAGNGVRGSAKASSTYAFYGTGGTTSGAGKNNNSNASIQSQTAGGYGVGGNGKNVAGSSVIVGAGGGGAGYYGGGGAYIAAGGDGGAGGGGGASYAPGLTDATIDSYRSEVPSVKIVIDSVSW